MFNLWFYSLSSVFLVSAVSLVGAAAIFLPRKFSQNSLIFLVSFAAGALLGDVFIHLLPEIAAEHGFNLNVSLFVLAGIMLGFVTEKLICWRHCHMPITKTHVHNFAQMNLIGDFFHNALDGVIIGVSYLSSVSLGIATTIAVIFHEVPQEIGDFGVLLHGGYSRRRALILNFLTACSAFVGVIAALLIGTVIKDSLSLFLSLAAGNFIYIASADLIPELHKETDFKNALWQFVFLCFGIGVMWGLRLFS